ncbi:MAG: hypothetical protein R3202_15025, partial [Candidatus Competibacterales bacterium]|nr:hypothetical protein [Candidatus Competibacterales bacterium]
QGPVRLALEQHLRLPGDQPAAEFGATLRLLLDDRPWQILETLTRPDTAQPLFVDGCARWLGRAESAYLEIPAGEHELRLESSVPVYLRLLAQDRPDYLFPGLNAPERDALDAREARVDGLPDESLWDLDPEGLDTALTSSDPARRARAARRLARDNRYRDGGLAGAMALYRLARERPDAPEVATLYRRIHGLHSFYRDLPPADGTAGLRQQRARFPTPDLLPLEDADQPLVLDAAAADAALTFLAEGLFTEVTPGQVQRYRLPSREVPSRLRVVVDRTTLERATAFTLQFDEGTPQRFVIHPGAAPLATRPDTGLAGLWLLGRLHDDRPCTEFATTETPCSTEHTATEHPADTLGAPFAARHDPAPLLAVGYLELPLPAATGELRVASEDRSLRIALQYRAGRSHQMDEREHQASRRRLGPARTLRLLQDQLRDDTRHWREAEPSADAAALLNHNRPLARLLQARARLFRSSVTDAPVARTAPLPGARMRALEASARRHQQQGEWFEALDDWMDVARGGRGADRHRALLAV